MNFFIFSQKKAFLTFRETKLSYVFLKKVFLYFRKGNFSTRKGKNFRMELSELKKYPTLFFIFQKMGFSSPKLEKLSIFREELAKSEKQTKELL